MSQIAALARQAGALTLDCIPPAVLLQARLCILDTVACVLAGTRTDEARLILDCEPPDAGGAASSVAIYGTAQRRSLASAVRVNGYLGDVLELNDLIGGHASIGNVCAALALAEAQAASGATLLEAVVRGIEVTSRLYAAVYPSLKRFTGMGLVPVGIPSSIGAAAACAHLLGLDETRTQHAMAIAGALAGWCPAEVIFGDGGTVKPMLFGAQTGAAGVTAALYARSGMTGPTKLLESPLGYFATAANHPQLDTGPWQDHWALAQPRRKLHACCGYLHSAIDAMGSLSHHHAEALARGRIDVHVPGYTADVVAKSRPPLSANDARFHLQYMLALVVCGADVITPEHSIDSAAQMARSEVTQAMARIHVVVDPALTHYQQCRIVVRDAASGEVLTEGVLDAPRGSPSRPLGDDDVVDKFLRLAGPVIGAAAAERCVQTLSALAGTPTVAGWLRELTPR